MDKRDPPEILPEGRHLAGLDSADKISDTLRKYRRSAKGKAYLEKYRDSESRKEVTQQYNNSEKGKLSRLKWEATEKGQDFFQSRKEQTKLFRKARAWLKSNPDKTIEDYLKSNGNQV